MKLAYIYLILLCAATGFLLFSAFSAENVNQNPKSNEAIIKFSHAVHADIATCEGCHTKVKTSKSLSDRLMPDHDSCVECHDVSDDTQCSNCHYDDVYEPLIQKASALFFDHNFHVEQQKMNCEACHSGFATVAYGFQAAQTNPIMENCYTCHNDKSVASNACESCHVSTVGLIPQEHKNVNFAKSHKFAANEFDANCVMCHDNNSCESCHVGTSMITEMNTTDDFYQPYSSTNFVDGVKQQQITRVHELNYRFVHGIDAKGRTAECQTCHQVDSFCANCHQSEGGDFAMSGVLPASHLKPNFFTIGVGSGGGDHAILARRDIERCVSCHDVQGADPTCITCHLDSDGIKGTNPRTHERNFMSDNKGDWHDSQGSVCYNCHTSASPTSVAGVGFCGYCHGSN
ncbi:MAG: cytochrome C [Ignavibacteriales bacterium]|nr:MAG: cytochrome C [Ignavibacteriales bacterium]